MAQRIRHHGLCPLGAQFRRPTELYLAEKYLQNRLWPLFPGGMRGVLVTGCPGDNSIAREYYIREPRSICCLIITDTRGIQRSGHAKPSVKILPSQSLKAAKTPL